MRMRQAGTFALRAGLPPTSTILIPGLFATDFSLTIDPATADMAVRVPVTTLAPAVGRRARVGVVVVDNGPVGVTDATLSVTLPPQTRLVSAISKEGTCAGKKLVCHLGAFASAQSKLVVLTLQGAVPGRGVISIRGVGSLPDALAENNAASVAVAVPKPAKRR